MILTLGPQTGIVWLLALAFPLSPPSPPPAWHLLVNQRPARAYFLTAPMGPNREQLPLAAMATLAALFPVAWRLLIQPTTNSAPISGIMPVVLVSPIPLRREPYTATGSTGNFNKTSSQTIPAFNYYNLTKLRAGFGFSGTVKANTFTPRNKRLRSPSTIDLTAMARKPFRRSST